MYIRVYTRVWSFINLEGIQRVTEILYSLDYSSLYLKHEHFLTLKNLTLKPCTPPALKKSEASLKNFVSSPDFSPLQDQRTLNPYT